MARQDPLGAAQRGQPAGPVHRRVHRVPGFLFVCHEVVRHEVVCHEGIIVGGYDRSNELSTGLGTARDRPTRLA
ncbi:hypothetical protein GCM10010214_60210 [Streptomyces abikoensis]|nr:hypothetical protein GCM10010214_60210 [Streptomyces abikoensis]